MLDLVKKALRITATDYDSEIQNYIDSALLDLGIAGVTNEGATFTDSTTNQLVITAVITYVKLHFGLTDDADRLKKSYDEQKAQMMIATGYTDWGE